MDKRDVIVVGAGPAGVSTSIFLVRRGYDVLLLDKAKFPRDKPCGDGQGPRTVEILKELGIYETMERLGFHRMYGVIVSSPDGWVCRADAREVDSYDEVGFCTPRKLFDNILKDAAIDSGVELIEEFWVNDLIIEKGKVCGVRGKYKGEIVEHRSKLVVGADGAHSVVGRRLGMLAQNPRHIVYAIRAYYEDVQGLSDSIEIYFDKEFLPGYAWIFPINNRMANVGLGMLASDYNQNGRFLEEHQQRFITTNKAVANRFKGARMVGELKGWRLPLGGGASRNYAQGALLIGDAASFIDPLSGEGVYEALSSGKMAAEVCSRALEKNDFSLESLQEYEKKWKGRFEEDFKYALRLLPLLRSPFLINHLVKRASRDKELAELLVGVIAHALPKRTLFSAKTLLKLLRPF